jgi:serine/threonine-protein kinase ATR
LASLTASSASFSDLTDGEKLTVVNTLKIIPCAGSGCLESSPKTAKIEFRCQICDSSYTNRIAKVGQHWNDLSPRKEYASFFGLLSRVLEAPTVRHSKVLRIQFAQVVRRLVNHTSDWDFLDLTSADLGRWSMRSFQSSLRELRISALSVCILPFLIIMLTTTQTSTNAIPPRNPSRRYSIPQQKHLS